MDEHYEVILKSGEESIKLGIRYARKDDVAEIRSLYKTTDKFNVSPYADIDSEELYFWVSDERSIVLVSTIKNGVVGFAYGVCVSPKWFFFDSFLISPKYRRLGIGKILYSRLTEICHFLGIELIQGIVKQGNDSSLDYWLQRGFDEGDSCIWVEHWINEE